MEKCSCEKHLAIKERLNNSSEYVTEVENASKIFSLFGDVNRMKILLALTEGELCVYHISEIIDLKQSATSQHLRKLKDSNLVKSRKEGNQVLYSIADEHVDEIIKIALKHASCKA